MDNTLIINGSKVPLDEAIIRLTASVGAMSAPQAALSFAFYNDPDIVHYSTLDAAEKALFAPASFGQFLLPRQGAPNTQWAPCLVMTPGGDPLTLIWYATFVKSGNFTQVAEYFDARNSRDMGKMAIPMTLDELGKLSARFQTGFVGHIKALPRDVRAASVQTQNMLALASKKVNNYYSSLNNAMQLRTPPNFLKVINASNSVATQLITNPIFPKPSSAPAPAIANAAAAEEVEEDDDLRSLTVADLLSQQTENVTDISDSQSFGADNALALKDLPDPHGHFRNLMRQYDIANMKVIPPCVRDAKGEVMQPSDYASKIVDGTFLRVAANLQTYQFTNRGGTLVRVLQLRLVSMDVLPTTMEDIIKKHPVAVAAHIAAFETLKSLSEEVPSFAEVQTHLRELHNSSDADKVVQEDLVSDMPTVDKDKDKDTETNDSGIAPGEATDTSKEAFPLPEDQAWKHLPFGSEGSLSSLSSLSSASTSPPSTPSSIPPASLPPSPADKRAPKRQAQGGNKPPSKRAKAATASAIPAVEVAGNPVEGMEGIESTV